jgi:putative glutathione S-transferase
MVCIAGFSKWPMTRAVGELFNQLDTIEIHFESQCFLWGNQLHCLMLRLFTTLIRFDIVYYSLFKCMRRQFATTPISVAMSNIFIIYRIIPEPDFSAIRQGLFP